MPDLMGMKSILVLNDEAHHCYREPSSEEEEELKGEEKQEAERNNEAARLWISGLEAVNRQIGITRIVDLSATPFFLRGSGYREGTLFTWTMSDFSLMAPSSVALSSCRAFQWPTTFLAQKCQCFATFGNISAPRCPKRAGERRITSIPSAGRYGL
jgi:hypothetical protein